MRIISNLVHSVVTGHALLGNKAWNLPRMEKKVREKVMVRPGFHLTDWNRLIRAMAPQVGKESVKITMEELSKHNSKYDCWMAYKGKVYNVTQYMAYHPGGEEILLESAGTDCTALYDQHHKWVNIGAMLGKCLVGTLEMPEEKPVESKSEEQQQEASVESITKNLEDVHT